MSLPPETVPTQDMVEWATLLLSIRQFRESLHYFRRQVFDRALATGPRLYPEAFYHLTQGDFTKAKEALELWSQAQPHPKGY